LRDDCAFGVRANKDCEDPTDDLDAIRDHANDHRSGCSRDGDRIHARPDNQYPPSPLVVQSSPDAKPMSYMLGRRVRYVDKDGKAIDPHMIRPGTRVHLDFDSKGAVRRVVVVEKE
jgi:hypothetical protein